MVIEGVSFTLLGRGTAVEFDILRIGPVQANGDAYIMNSIGPKQLPWGIPVATSKSRDCFCSTTTCCFRPDRNDLIHKRA